jgi:hypothetical protein
VNDEVHSENCDGRRGEEPRATDSEEHPAQNEGRTERDGKRPREEEANRRSEPAQKGEIVEERVGAALSERER